MRRVWWVNASRRPRLRVELEHHRHCTAIRRWGSRRRARVARAPQRPAHRRWQARTECGGQKPGGYGANVPERRGRRACHPAGAPAEHECAQVALPREARRVGVERCAGAARRARHDLARRPPAHAPRVRAMQKPRTCLSRPPRCLSAAGTSKPCSSQRRSVQRGRSVGSPVSSVSVECAAAARARESTSSSTYFSARRRCGRRR